VSNNNKKNRDERIMLSGTEDGEILARLSERVERAVATIQDLRREREQLQSRVTELETRLADADQTSTRLETLEEEHDRFQRERGEIRDRIETILANLETLEPAEAGEAAE
jgi:FtsZ-binding cell division protein ZapB